MLNAASGLVQFPLLVILIAVAVTVTCRAAAPEGSGVPAGKPRATVGAYYFDGWSGKPIRRM